MNDMLRHSLLATILGASLIAATVQAADTTQTVVISARALPPTARLLETPLPPDTDMAFQLANGRLLTIRTAGNSVVAQYGRRLPMYFAYEGEGRYVARDGQLWLRFAADQDSALAYVVLSAPGPWL